jgi:AraC-like DNA-binding protein
MPGSIASAFSNAEDFEAALREEGYLCLLVTGGGEFRARLTRVTLHSLRLSAVEEHLSRTALVHVPAGMMLVALAQGRAFAPFWGGVRLGVDEIIRFEAGHGPHTRSNGPCRWESIWLPAAGLARFGTALTGAAFAVSSTRWRLRPAAIRHLRHLYSAGIDASERRSSVFIGNEAAHGLEQQLIEALIECLSNGSNVAETRSAICHREVARRFEALLQAQPERAFRMTEISEALSVPPRTLSPVCEEQLDMAPAEYVRRRRMQLVHRALRPGNLDIAGIAGIARQSGFRSLGRFAAEYRALYGELPPPRCGEVPSVWQTSPREAAVLSFCDRVDTGQRLGDGGRLQAHFVKQLPIEDRGCLRARFTPSVTPTTTPHRSSRERPS